MVDKARLVIVLGPNLDGGGQRSAIEVDIAKEFQQKDSSIVIIGDGKRPVSVQEIASRIKEIPGKVELFIAAHGAKSFQATLRGDRVTKDSVVEMILHNIQLQKDAKALPAGMSPYWLALDSGRDAKTSAMITFDGMEMPESYLVPIADVFKQMPPNVSSIYLGACYSETALDYSQHLPAGTLLYPSSTKGEQTFATANGAMLYQIATAEPDANGLRIPRRIGDNATTVSRGADQAPTKPLSKYAIGGDNPVIMDMTKSMKDLVGGGHVVNAASKEEVVRGLTDVIAFDKGLPRSITGIDKKAVQHLVEAVSTEIAKGNVPDEKDVVNIALKGKPPIRIFKADVARYLVDAEIRRLAEQTGTDVAQATEIFAACTTKDGHDACVDMAAATVAEQAKLAAQKAREAVNQR